MQNCQGKILLYCLVKMREILIIDKEPFIQDVLEIRLSSKGNKVLLAKDGEGGFSIAQKQALNLIIMDILIPHENDGYRLCQRLKGAPKTKDISIFILTKRPKDPETSFKYHVWAEEYIQKPFSLNELLKKIDKLFENRL